jgi:hypothetical protein
MGRIALSISHESEFAVAIAYGVRTTGGRFLYPPDIEERVSEREASLMKRFVKLRDLAREVAVTEARLAATAAPGKVVGAGGRRAEAIAREERTGA